MNLLYKLIFRRKIKQQEKIISSLEDFIKNIYFGEDLTREQSMENLEEGLVEIIYNSGAHFSNGLLITENGCFLTAKHCVEKDLSSLKIRLHDGNIFPIKEAHSYSKKGEDMAIAKADIPGKYNVKRYKIFNTNNISGFSKIPVALLTRRNNKINTSYGFINEWNINKINLLGGDFFVNQFSLNISSKKGDSGGIFTSSDGRLVGIASTGNEYNFTSGIKILDALELIFYYKRKIEEKLK